MSILPEEGNTNIEICFSPDTKWEPFQPCVILFIYIFLVLLNEVPIYLPDAAYMDVFILCIFCPRDKTQK